MGSVDSSASDPPFVPEAAQDADCLALERWWNGTHVYPIDGSATARDLRILVQVTPEQRHYLFRATIPRDLRVVTCFELVIPRDEALDILAQFTGQLFATRIALLLLSMLVAARQSGRRVAAKLPQFSEVYEVSPTGDIKRKQLEPQSVPVSVPPITRT